MRILDRYIGWQILLTTLIAVIVLTGVVVLGSVMMQLENILGNAEIAGGMYVFGFAGADYMVVCKHLDYKFLRPCFGPALYKIRSHEDIEALVSEGTEFNVTLTMDIVQQIKKPGDKDRRVGRANVTFHVTPKLHNKAKGRDGKASAKDAV